MNRRGFFKLLGAIPVIGVALKSSLLWVPPQPTLPIAVIDQIAPVVVAAEEQGLIYVVGMGRSWWEHPEPEIARVAENELLRALERFPDPEGIPIVFTTDRQLVYDQSPTFNFIWRGAKGAPPDYYGRPLRLAGAWPSIEDARRQPALLL